MNKFRLDARRFSSVCSFSPSFIKYVLFSALCRITTSKLSSICVLTILTAFTASAQAQDSDNLNPEARHYIIVLNELTSTQETDSFTIDRERDQLRKRTILDYTDWYEIKVQYEYSNVFNGFAANLSDQAYAALLSDSRVHYIEVDENLQEQDYAESVTQPSSNIDLTSTDHSSAEDHSSVTIYLLGGGAKPSRSILKSRIVSGVNLTGQGGLDNWQNCKKRNKTAARLARESKKNKHQINLYPVKVSDCNGQTSLSKIIAGLEWVMSRYIGQEGVIDVPLSSNEWAGKQSVIQAIDSLNSLGFVIVDRSNSAHRYRREGATDESVSKPISASLKMLKKKQKRELKRRQEPNNQNSLGSLSILSRNSVLANRSLIDPNFTPPLEDILAFTPMILDCVPQSNTSAAIFHGCYDWHSSVHGNWALLWASRVANDPSLRDGIFNRYTEGNVSNELSRVLPFEHTYGFAWFLALAHEAELLGNTALRPLADYFYSELLATLDINALPVVGVGGNPISTALLGSYDNDAWAVFQAYQWAEYIDDIAAQNMLIERVTLHYQNVRWSNAYSDFFDPKFVAAMMMVKMNITGPSWDNLMAEIAQGSLAVPLLTGVSHSEGLVSARAWGLWALYARTGNATYLNAYNAHVTFNLSRISFWSESYVHSHWLGQLAIYSLQIPEIIPASGNPINFAPIVNAGANQAITLPNIVTLSGSISDDGLPAVTTQWSVVSGPGTVTFGDANAVSTTASFSDAGNYVLRLSADDGDLVSNDELQVIVFAAGSTFNAINSVSGGNTSRGNWVLGYRFTVNTPITVSELAIAEVNGNNVLDNNQAASIAIWTNSGEPLSQTSIPTSTPLSGDGYYVAIAPLELSPGEYVIAASYNSNGEPYRRQASVITAPQISIDQALWASGSNLNFPTGSNGTVYDDGFIGPMFTFSETTASNQAPSVYAGTDQNIELANTANLSGSISDDGLPNPPSIVTTQWSVVSGPGTVTFGDSTALITTANFSASGNYVLRLSADDGELVSSDELQVFVSTTGTQNQAPTVFAGADQATILPNVVTLSASVTDDGLPNPPSTVTTQWSVVSGPGTVTFGDANAVSTTAIFTAAGSYVLRLSADDGELVSNDELQVFVSTAGATLNAVSSVSGGSTSRGNWVLGYRFTVHTPITVSELGIAEVNGNNVLDNNQAASIAIWTNSGERLSQTSIPATTSLSGDGYYVAISPTELSPGEYVIAASFTSSGEPYRRQASVITAPQISIDQALWLSSSNLDFPTSSNGTYWDDGFIGPVFTFSETTASNQAPTVYVGTDQNIELGNSANLSGSISDDGLPNPPSTVTTQWSVVSGPGAVTFANATAVSTTANFSATGNYVLRLSADDGELVSNDELQVFVSTPVTQNQAPTVYAGTDQNIELGNSANLSGSISDDGLPNPPSTVTTQWSVVSGPGTVTFGDANSVSTTASFSAAGNYVLRLSANDGELVSNDELQVFVSTTVAQNQAPTVYAGTDQDIELGNSANLSGSISDDGLPNPPSTVTTQWSVVSGPGTVTFGDANSVSTTASFSAAGNYVLRLSANDGELVSNDELQVFVSTAVTTLNAISSVSGGNTRQGNWVLGYRFTVHTPITVSELGITEVNGNNTLDNNQAASIAIWTNSGERLSQTSIPTSTPLSGDGYYVAISPTELSPGEYVIAASFTSNGEPYRRQASVITAPQISIDQALWSSGSNLRLPTSSNGTYWDDGFIGPVFTFSEP